MTSLGGFQARHEKATFPGDCRKLPGDLGNAPARGRHSSPQNQGGLKKLEVKSKVSAQVEVEEHLYGRQGEHLYGRPVVGPELGRCKAIKLTFNDPNTTQARSTFSFLLLSK